MIDANEMLLTLSDVTRRLDELGIEYMVTGSFAMSTYVTARTTLDIDIVIEIAGINAQQFEAKFAPDYYVSAESVDRARQKAPGLTWEQADAMALPYADDTFDAVTVGFGARNFGDLPQGLREMVRVVKPGGRVVILEITTPQKPPLSTFFSVWFDRIVPLLGRFDDAYTYLPASVKRFPGPEPLAGELVAAGCKDVGWILTAGGIIALHHGTVS